MVPPIERFRLANAAPSSIDLDEAAPDTTARPEVARRRVASNGRISFASTHYLAGKWLAGETVEVTCDGGVMLIAHRGVLVASHARRHKPAEEAAAIRRGQDRRPTRAADRRPSASSASVTRKVDSSGNVCFAGTSYRVGNKFRRRQVQVAVVGGTVEIVHRRGTHPRPPGQARPHPRTRSPRQPRRPTEPNQRRLTPPRHTTTGARTSHGYRVLTSGPDCGGEWPSTRALDRSAERVTCEFSKRRLVPLASPEDPARSRTRRSSGSPSRSSEASGSAAVRVASELVPSGPAPPSPQRVRRQRRSTTGTRHTCDGRPLPFGSWDEWAVRVDRQRWNCCGSGWAGANVDAAAGLAAVVVS